MPGPNPSAAVDAFLQPLKDAFACVGIGHLVLSPGARGVVGKTHAWTLNSGEPVKLSGQLSLRASMRFEVLDQGQSQGRSRYRVTTREYIYSATVGKTELLAAHWHPDSRSPAKTPHYHFAGVAINNEGVYLDRAHIPSHRVSFEEFIRLMITDMGAEPRCDDWETRLQQTESTFREHSSWGTR